MKEITREQINALIKCGRIKNTKRGYVDTRNGETIGYHATVGKQYVIDKYANIAFKFA